MGFFLRLLFFLCVLVLAFGYIDRRLVVTANLQKPWKTIARVVLVALMILFPGTFLFMRLGYENWNDKISWLVYPGMGVVSFVFTGLFIRDVLRLLSRGAKKMFLFAGNFFGSSENPARSYDPERRRFLISATNLVILGVSGSLTGYGVYQARRRPAIVKVDIPIPGLPEDLAGFRIVQITDIHAGLTVKRDWIEMVVAEANKLSADIIALTGDLADGTVPHLRRDVAPVGNLSASHGRFFITGNHEYYSGAEPWVEEVKRLGFTVLLNEHRVLQRGAGKILIAGVTDYTAGQFIESHRSDPGAAFSGAPGCDVRVLLAHQPRSVYAAAPLGFDLMICGHTHGGQFFPWNLWAALGQPYLKGLHKHAAAGEGWVYVSKGTGYWGPPVRLGTRSEITVFRLTGGDKHETRAGSY
jgi:predicted MPP superfamily phosphohydrolase